MGLRWRDCCVIMTWENLRPVFTRVMFKRFVPKLPPLFLPAAHQCSANTPQSQRRRDRPE